MKPYSNVIGTDKSNYLHSRTRSCPPRSPTPPPSTLKRTQSSHDLTDALHLIGLGDNGGDKAGLKSPPTTALSRDMNSLVYGDQKANEGSSRPRHARKFSLQKRKKSFTGMTEKLERPNMKSKRARSNEQLERGRPGSGSYSEFEYIQLTQPSLSPLGIYNVSNLLRMFAA